MKKNKTVSKTAQDRGQKVTATATIEISRKIKKMYYGLTLTKGVPSKVFPIWIFGFTQGRYYIPLC